MEEYEDETIENIMLYGTRVNEKGMTEVCKVRIKDVGEVVERFTLPTIERKDRSRLITVSGIVTGGTALSEAVAKTESVISSVDMPAEITTVIAGDYEDQQELFGDMIVLIILIIILVYIVMAAQFESFLSPFVIMFSIPFALVGVALGMLVSGSPIGAMGLVGIIILLGIVVKNGIVLIDHTILLRERGYSAVEASAMAARSRLRPILMTTLTTVLGMLPMAIGLGEGSELWKGLGVVVCWGLSISTLVTLVLIPTVYCVFATRQERRRARKLESKV